MDRDLKDICKEIAKEKNLPVEMVESIVNAPFEFAREKIKEGDIRKFESFGSILIKKLGTFRVKEMDYYKNKKIYLRKKANSKIFKDKQKKLADGK